MFVCGIRALSALFGIVGVSLGVAPLAGAEPLDPETTVIEVRSITPQISGPDGDGDSTVTVYPDHVEADRASTHDERPMPPGLWPQLLDRAKKLDAHTGGLRAAADVSYTVLVIKEKGVVVKTYDSRLSTDVGSFIRAEIMSPVRALFVK